MVRIASTMLRNTELEDILEAITRELSRVINFDRSSVALMSPDGKALVLRHIFKGGGDVDKIGDGRHIPLNDKSIIGWVALHGEPILRRHIATDGRFFEVVKEEQLQSDMVVPLIARGKVMGTLNVGSYAIDGLVDADLEMLVNCGDIACGAIEHALLLQEAKDLGERYRTLRRNASDIIMLIDRNTGQLVEVNRKSCEALGYTEEELLRRSFFDLFPHEDQFQARRDFINVLSQKSRSFLDRRLINRDGRIIFVDVSASLIEIGKDTFIQVLFHDISQRRMLEQQIILQNKNLQDANRKLREVDEMKTEFLANISHELRTPLSIIIAYSEALREASLTTDERAGFVDVIAENGEHLLQLINDLIDLSNLEISGAMLSISLSHIHDVVRSLWPGVHDEAEQKGISLAFVPGYEIPVTYIDNRRIQQVLVCLIQNAVKFSEEGGRVEVRTSRTARGVRVEVEDRGLGIPEDQLATIFDTFHQIDGSATRRWGGLGIGLAMAKHVVELHGGEISVSTEEGRGSTFAFEVPVDPDSALPTDEGRARPSAQEPAPQTADE